MISYIKGTVNEASPSFIIMDCRDIGYKILTPPNLFSKITKNGSQIRIYTSLVIRELSQTLYGFLQKEERDLFEELISITGIGPKAALNLIGHLSSNQLQEAICRKDISAISQVPGIGKKTAERLLLELRNRLTKKEKKSFFEGLTLHIEDNEQRQKIKDAINALVNLGYNRIKAQSAIEKSLKHFSASTDLPLLIKNALKYVN